MILNVVLVKVLTTLNAYHVNKVTYLDKELMKIVLVWMDTMMMESVKNVNLVNSLVKIVQDLLNV